MASIANWLTAFRLRTLPLSLSSIITGSALAYFSNKFSFLVGILAATTTIFLQILSNLANDYGDFIKGTDNKERTGPVRSLQSGVIRKKEMKIAIVFFVILSLVSGCSLLYFATRGLSWKYPLFFFTLGIAAILAAVKYTIGKHAYGYRGLGDLFVFVFFGITGVMGTFWLHTHTFEPIVLLPAVAIGLLSVGVLNLNNMRDIENDEKSNKKTIPVLIGIKNALIYHSFLLLTPSILLLLFVYYSPNHELLLHYLFLVASPILLLILIRALKSKSPLSLDPLLKLLALTTLLISILFGIGINF